MEVAFSLSLVVVLVLGAVDLGYGVFRQHVLSQSTRLLARRLIVQGKLASRLAPLGPDSITLTAQEPHVVTDFIGPKLVGWDRQEVRIQIDWIDGDNDVRRGDRVRVTFQAPYRPILAGLFSSGAIPLRATSTMAIAH